MATDTSTISTRLIPQKQYTTPQAITTLTMNGGTIIGALTTMAVATFAEYTYESTSAEWWRTG